jgi:hypothetical protein
MLWVACVPARANAIIDPAMKVLEDDFSSALLQGTTFFPNGNGGGIFGFFNSTGHTITELTFEAIIAPNISQTDISAAFVCNQGNFNPFFEFCSVNYVGATGQLTIAFWGTNPLTGTEGTSNLAGQQKGVPALLPGCDANPDGSGCTGVGHFAISLNNSFSLNDVDGGWSFAENPALFNPGGPTFTATEIQTTFGAFPGDTVPEPALFGVVAISLAGFGWIRTRRRPLDAAPDPENRS